VFKQLPYKASSNQLGKLNYDPAKPKDSNRTGNHHGSFVPCFPLESLLLAINQTRVDYFSLDVEGMELEVLETIPWSRLDIRTLSVEDKHVKRGSKAVVKYMTDEGYRLAAELRTASAAQHIYVHDLIFVKKW